MIFDTFTKTLSGKSLTRNEGKDHIYLDKFGMGSIYVIKSRFYEESRIFVFLLIFPIRLL